MSATRGNVVPVPTTIDYLNTREKGHAFFRLMRGYDEEGSPLKLNKAIMDLPEIVADALKNDIGKELEKTLKDLENWWKLQYVKEIDTESMVDFLTALLDKDPLCELRITQFILEDERIIHWWFYRDTAELNLLAVADLAHSLLFLDPGRNFGLVTVVLRRFAEVYQAYPELMMAEETTPSLCNIEGKEGETEEAILVLCLDQQGCFVDVEGLIEEADQLFSGGNPTSTQASA